MSKPRNQRLHNSLKDFCQCAVLILLSKHESEFPLIHLSGDRAAIDGNGRVIAPDSPPQGINDNGLLFFIFMHGNLPDYSNFISKNWDALEILAEYESCRKEMESDPKVSRHLNTAVWALDSGASHDVKFYAAQFLEELFLKSEGIQFVEQIFNDLYNDFEDFLYSDVVKYTTFVAIWGLHRWSVSDLPEPRGVIVQGHAVLTRRTRESFKPIHLTPRARIVPSGLSSIYKYISVQGGFTTAFPNVWDFPYILEFSGSVRKYFKGASKQSKPSSSQYLQHEIAKLIGALRLFKKGDIQYGILGSVTHGWLRQFGRRSLRTPPKPIIRNTYDITDEEERELVKFCKWFTNIKYNESLELAMNRFNISYERSEFKGSLIDQIIAFEALLIQEEYRGIGKTLSRRVANIIAESVKERQTIYDEIYDAYYIRSKIVHGDQNNEVTSILETKHKPMIWYISDIQELLRETIRVYSQLVKDGQSKIDIINSHDESVPGRVKKRRRKGTNRR